MSTPIRKLLSSILVLLSIAAAAGALAGCGSDEEEARAIIDDAFSTDIQSAVMTLNLEVAVEGSEELSEPVNVQLTGPFQSNGPDKLPSFDFDVSLQGPGAEAVPPFGLTSTGDNVFVELQGTSYEVGEEIVAQQNEQLAAQSDESQSLAAFGIDPQEWIVEPAVEGDAEVAGVETDHVTAAIDVPALVTDVNGALQEASELGGATATKTPELTEEQLAEIEESIEDPRFEVFVGKDDDALRRLVTSLNFTLPEEAQTTAGGATGGSVSFDLEFAEVGEEQEIAAPPNPQPLANLASQFGGIGGLFGGSTLPGGGITPPDTGTTPPSGTPDPQALEEFSRCIEQADPGDAAAIQRCNELVAP